jgi:hypothetical protein
VRIAVLLALAWLAPPDRFDAAAERVRFPAPERVVEWGVQGDAQRKILLEFTDRRKYAHAFRVIEDKMGLLPEDPDVEVDFEETDDRRPARAGGKEGKGKIFFNLRRLAELQRKIDEFNAQRRAGRNLVWTVPPPSYSAIVTHELTHVVCGSFPERWITEGLACWVADDTGPLKAFVLRGGRVDTLDVPLSEDDAYPRGTLFFTWMEARWNRDTVRKFVARVASRSESAGDALFAVTGNTWARMAAEEQTWGQAHCERLRTLK